MKTKKCFTFLFLILITFSLHAAKYRVNNNTSAGAHYTSLTAAQNDPNVLAGDTLYLEASSSHYAGITFTKKLIVIGPGFFLGDNPQTQANVANAVVGQTVFAAGSEGSVVMGVYFFNENTTSSLVKINANNVVLKRNRFYKYYNSGSTTVHAVEINASNIVLVENYIHVNGGVPYTVKANDNSNNLLIRNNYISNAYTSSSYRALIMTFYCSGEVLNNVFNTGIEVQNSLIANNILMDGTVVLANCSIANNICNLTQFPSGNNNQRNVTIADVLNLSSSSSDGKYKLKNVVGNPAKNAGTDGTDIGMFGGPSPYVLSGMPDLPAVYFFSAPSSGSSTSGLPASVKIKSNR